MAGPGALLLLGGILGAIPGGLPQNRGGPRGGPGGSETPRNWRRRKCPSCSARTTRTPPHCFTRTLQELSCFWDSPGPAEPNRYRLEYRLEQDPWQPCPLSATALSPLSPGGPRSRFWCSLPAAATVTFVPLELRLLPGTPPGTARGPPERPPGATPETSEGPPERPPGTTPKTAERPPEKPPKTSERPPETPPKTTQGPPGTPPKTSEEPPGTTPKTTERPPEKPPKTPQGPPGTPPKTSEEPPGTPPKTTQGPPGTPPKSTQEPPETIGTTQGPPKTSETPPETPLFQRTIFIDQLVLPGPPQNVSVSAGGARGELCVRWAPPPGPYLHSSLVFELALSAPGGPPENELDAVTLGLSCLLVLLVLGLGALGLLGHRRTLRAKLWPPVPGPEREFEGLFSNYGGNFQLWLCQGPGSPCAPPRPPLPSPSGARGRGGGGGGGGGRGCGGPAPFSGAAPPPPREPSPRPRPPRRPLPLAQFRVHPVRPRLRPALPLPPASPDTPPTPTWPPPTKGAEQKWAGHAPHYVICS
ncbi:uncharacterized protein LOC143693067 isoform X2 [Agelaius phoeniceus]|uniref:uncharacterized protein LOC143693067 isoform X2 n=1 Tax=Agelaius phoeniceus TaxID=39638 RepID=UPI004055163C